MVGKALRQEVRNRKVVGAYQNVREHRLPYKDGVILLICSDGDRFYDAFMRQVTYQFRHRRRPRIHPLARHGGSLLLAPNSPLVKPGRTTDLDYLDEIEEAHRLKGINAVAAHPHFPCGKAHAHGVNKLSTHDSLLLQAETRLEETFAWIQLVSFSHIDYGDGEERSYIVSGERWEKNGYSSSSHNGSIP